MDRFLGKTVAKMMYQHYTSEVIKVLKETPVVQDFEFASTHPARALCVDRVIKGYAIVSSNYSFDQSQ
jgi:hypothetical protein